MSAANNSNEKLGSNLKNSENQGQDKTSDTLFAKISKFKTRQQEKISKKIKQSKEKLVSSASATSAIVREKAALIVDSFQDNATPISELSEDTSGDEDHARAANYSGENLEHDTKSGASQWYGEMSATLLGKINRFKKRQQEKISSSTLLPFLKETKEKLVSSTSIIKEKTRHLLMKNSKVAPMEVAEEDVQNGSSETSLKFKAVDYVIPLPPPSRPIKDYQPAALNTEFVELIKQSELLQQQLYQQLPSVNISSKPDKVQKLDLPQIEHAAIPDAKHAVSQIEHAALSEKRRVRIKKQRKISVPELCSCVSVPPDKDVIHDVDYHMSVFVDNPDLLTPEEQLASTINAGRDGLISEYMDIRKIAYHDTFNVASLPANSSKNRYSDVLCYDKTRVVLEDDKCLDYINANYVNSFEQKKGYICCQGPLARTITDFWRMVWQEKVCTIVMTTRLVEKGRTKCATYWPQEVNSLEEYGSNFKVMNMNISKEADIQKTALCIYNKRTNETRFLKHFLFLKWPDYGIPSSAEAFLRLVVNVREAQAEGVKQMSEWKAHPRGPPIIVHCSAGVGRSGTFICADVCIYMLDVLGRVNIEQVVRNIRTQRALAVQMPDQYVFCHIAILEYAQRKHMIPDNIDIPDVLKEEDEDDVY